MKKYKNKKTRRAIAVRANMQGTSKFPRLSVHKTSKHIYGQLVDDTKGKTMASYSSSKITSANAKDKTKTDIAKMVGEEIAKLATKMKIKSVIFDRGGSRYQGRIKALAESARAGGLKF
jgi:large subunit ribosomal protein L18